MDEAAGRLGRMSGVATGLEIGSVFRGYRVDSVLGHGGMGAVYLATHLRLERKAALKVLLPELSVDESFRERFIRESQLAASLEHANIVPVYDADEEDGVLYLAMRFIQGEDLGSLLRSEGPLDLQFVVSVIEQAASALDAAHASGLVHRDVKPANILIAEGRSHVYLTDFGVAKRMKSLGLTRTGFFVGTVDYCAPEQIEGKEVDARTDVYALGGVLFHCLAGHPPYEKDSDVAVITAHLLEPPPAVSSKRENLSPHVDAVIQKAMAKRPDDRFQSAGELAAAAREAVTGTHAVVTVPTEPSPNPAAGTQPAETVDLTQASSSAAASDTAPAAAPAPTRPSDGAAPPVETQPGAVTAPAAPAARRLRVSRRTMSIAGVVCLAAVAAVVAVLLTKGGSKASSPPPAPPSPPSSPATTPGPVVPSYTRPSLASAGSFLFVTSPRGTVVQLDPGTLRRVSSIPDPARPRAMVASGSRIVTADDRSVTAYRTPGFTPVGAADFGSRPMLAAGTASAPIAVARSVGSSGGKVCVVNATATDPSKMVGPCVSILGFAPSGLGVASGGRVFVADAKSGQIEQLTVQGNQLAVGNEHSAGTQPAGRLIASGTHLFVPVARGVAVLDLDSGTLQRTIALGARPSDIWFAASTGRLFAVLPGRGKMAVVDIASPGRRPRLIPVGKNAVSLGGGRLAAGAEAVYVGNLRNGTVARLDASSGKVITSRVIGALRTGTPSALTVNDVTFTSSGRTVRAVIHLGGGTLPAAGLVTKNARIDLGSAALAMWQGGIVTNVGTKQGSGLKITFTPEAGRLIVNAEAKRGAFTHLAVHLGPRHRSVVLAFTRAAPKQVTPPPAASPPPSSSPPPSPSPSPSPTPPPPPPPPPPTIG